MAAPEIDKELFREKWTFPWLEMDVLIGGKSSVDLPRVGVKDLTDATRFVANYGYNPDDPRDHRKIHAVIVEAACFMERFLMPFDGRGRRCPPRELIECDDIREILLWASDSSAEGNRLRAWSCALLRVVHTIAHIEGVKQRVSVDVAREQIQDRFLKHVYQDFDGRIWLGQGENRIELDRVEWKSAKTRESMILKLLHKRANVAETIYDLLGVRVITRRLCDVPLVIKYLRQYYMITFANAHPGRSRNTLLDMDGFRQTLDGALELFDSGKINEEEFERMLDRMSEANRTTRAPNGNPHSASTYRAIQLTCRQLIRGRSQAFGWLDQLEQYMATKGRDGCDPMLEGILQYIKNWPGVEKVRESATFFPFEVQVMDRDSYLQNMQGDASHERYRRSQIRAARRRVLHEVLRLR